MKQTTSWLMAGLAAIVMATAPATLCAQGASQQQTNKAQTAQHKVERKLGKVQGKRDKAAYDSSTIEGRRAEGNVNKESLKDDKVQPKKADKGKRHAYGKDKDSLQGRDFGQARAAQARLQGEKADTLRMKTDKAMETVKVAREKVDQAKANLEKAKKAGKLSETQYAEKMKKVEAAQQAIDKLEAKAKKGKTLLEGATVQGEIEGATVQGEVESEAAPVEGEQAEPLLEMEQTE
jgi:hypothetical protein